MDVLDLVNDHNQVGPGHDPTARPYICEFQDCDKAFARKSDLQRHMRIHTNDRPFVCTFKGCGKSFIQRSALTVHIRVHTGERPHHCEFQTCLKSFADSSSLARHRRIHTGKRPYACKVPGCARSFARRNTWFKHYKRQHPHLPPPASATIIRGASQQSQRVRQLHSGCGKYDAVQSPLDSNGQSQYYVKTPSTAGHPHTFAAPAPSEGAAYSVHGGFSGPVLQHPHGPQQLCIPPNGNGLGLGGLSGTVRSPYNLSPAASQQGPFSATTEHSSLSGSHTPHSANDLHKQQQQQQHGGEQQHFGVGHHVWEQQQQQHPPYSAGQPLVRYVSDGGMMYIKSEPHFAQAPSQRAVSDPTHRYQPYSQPAAWSTVGGGFHAGQLAMPSPFPVHQHHQLQPFYQPGFVPTPAFHQYRYSSATEAAKVEATHQQAAPDQSGSSPGSRDMTPEPLVELQNVPSFAFHAPHGHIMNMSYSAVHSHQFNPLTQAPPQIALATPQSARLHSAPPGLQRFHSMPTVPTLGSAWSEDGPLPGDAHSLDEGRVDADSDEWEDLEEQMLSREATEGLEETLVDNVDESSKENSGDSEAKAPSASAPSHWGQPVEYPVPPRREGMRNPFSSSASSTSTSSTLVASLSTQPSNTLPPISVFSQAPPHPMALTPVNSTGFYPTPITPVEGWTHEPFKGPHPMLGSPAVLTHPYPPSQQSGGGTEQEDITLTTPLKASHFPQQLARKDSGSVTTVGLGIANVHFEDRSNSIVKASPEADEEIRSEDEDEDEDEGADAGEIEDDDGSDGEFLPGKKAKSGKKGGRGGKSKRARAKAGARRS